MKKVFLFLTAVLAVCLLNSCSSGQDQEEEVFAVVEFANYQITDITSNTATVKYSYKIDNLGKRSYYMGYVVSTEPIGYEGYKDMVRIPTPEGKNVLISLDNLQPGTEYYVISYIVIDNVCYQSPSHTFRTEGNSSSNGDGGNGNVSGGDNNGGNASGDTVTGIQLVDTQSEVTMKVGETLVVHAAVIPANAKNRSISWTMENADVAGYYAGVMTYSPKGHSSYIIEAKKVGNAKLTAKSADGGFEVAISITVEE